MPGQIPSVTTDRHILYGLVAWAPEEGSGINRKIGKLTQQFNDDSLELFVDPKNLVRDFGKPPIEFSDADRGRQIGSTIANGLMIIPDFLVGSGERKPAQNNES